MDKNSVIERLNQLVQAGGKLKPIELTLNMPQNCLSNYASGKKELPGKWVKPLSDHLENLKDKLLQSQQMVSMEFWLRGLIILYFFTPRILMKKKEEM